MEEITSIGGGDAYVSKFYADGNFLWVLTWGNIGYEHSQSISSNGDHFWLAGEVGSSYVDYDPGPEEDIKDGGRFLIRLDLDGNYVWSTIWDIVVFNTIDLDTSGNSYLTGQIVGFNTDFDPGPGYWFPDNDYVEGGKGAYVMKVLPNGLFY